jgi:TetR/AcrR family transcriptional repressor of bet genes
LPRSSNTTQRRAQIAEALLAVMARRGYERASVIDIAARARLAPGLVHYHFKTKLDILVVATRLLAARHLAILDDALVAAAEPAAQVAAFIDIHLGLGAHADPDALACWVSIGGEAVRERRIQIEYERALADIADRLTAVIARGVTARAFAKIDTAAAAAALVALIEGYFVVAATAREVVPSGSAASCARAMAEGLLRPTRPRALRRRR